MGGHKKFIDKRKDVLHTFKVVARSQQDPLAADETAPQGVLLSTQEEDETKEEEHKLGVYFDDEYNYLQHLRGTKEAVDWDTPDLEVYTIRKEDSQATKKEQREKNKLVLPSSVFESFVEEPIGLLNKAAPLTGPRPELDPDVVAALDDECAEISPEDEDAFPDNFVTMLNAEESINEEDDEWEDAEEDHDIWGNCKETSELETVDYPKLGEYRSKAENESDDDEEQDFSSDFNDSEDEEDEARDKVGGLDGKALTFRDEETKSHFTSYSLTSSVLRRNAGLSKLDDCFEGKFLREYDDDQVGALDGEDIEGFVNENSPHFAQVMEGQRKQIEKNSDKMEDKDRIVQWIKDMDIKKSFHNTKDEVNNVVVEDNDPAEKWDCESILSTYSNLYNHPRTITDPPRRKKIAVDPSTGLPREFNNRDRGLTSKALKEHDRGRNGVKELDDDMDTRTLLTSISAISMRLPGETSEERRERKKALKELRRERRIEKKINREAFKEEKKMQEKVLLNNRVNKILLV